MIQYLQIALLLFGFSYCANKPPVQIPQGIRGKVIWFEGNMMPTIGGKTPGMPKGKPIQREIYIYALTNRDQTVISGRFFSKINNELITTVQSNQQGVFSVELTPGKYSIMVKEEKGLYANLFDGLGNIHPVEVQANKVTEIIIKVDYQAAY